MYTELINAIKQNDSNAVLNEINLGADINSVIDEEGCYAATPLFVACLCGHTDIVSLLLTHGAVPQIRQYASSNLPNNWDQFEYNYLYPSELHAAVYSGNLDIIEQLLALPEENRLEVDTQDCSGFTPLHYAASMNRIDIINHLVSAGADVDAQSGCDLTPAILAINDDFLQDIPEQSTGFYFIDEIAANLHIPQTLRLSVESRVASVNALLDNNASPHLADDTHYTVLFAAAEKRLTSIVDRVILQPNLELQTADNGQTPIHIALENGDITIARTLVHRFIDIVKDNPLSIRYDAEMLSSAHRAKVINLIKEIAPDYEAPTSTIPFINRNRPSIFFVSDNSSSDEEKMTVDHDRQHVFGNTCS